MTWRRRLIVFRGADGDWYWKLVARNGRTVAASEEGFRRKAYALAKGVDAADGKAVIEIRD